MMPSMMEIPLLRKIQREIRFRSNINTELVSG